MRDLSVRFREHGKARDYAYAVIPQQDIIFTSGHEVEIMWLKCEDGVLVITTQAECVIEPISGGLYLQGVK